MDVVDSHCHLDFDPLAGDVDGVLSRAAAAGVSTVVVPSYDAGSWPAIGELSRRTGVFAAYGLHPWEAAQDLDPRALEGHLRRDGVAVGEIGLDFKIEGGPGFRERQRKVFRLQVEMAVSLGLPVILHCRGAFEEMVEDLAPFTPHLRGVVHAYSRGPDLARRFLDLGLHIAFGGAVTRPRARRAHLSAVAVPADRLLVETDAPSIGLEGVPAEETEPRHVADVVRSVAFLREEDPIAVAAQTTANARALFGLDG